MNLSNKRSFVLTFLMLMNLAVFSQVVEVKIDLNKPYVKASDLFSEIRYTKLETTRECLLRYPAGLEKIGENLVIQDMKILVFSSDGQFRNGFGSSGKGPGEYIAVNDFWIDKREKHVEILTGTSIIRYNYSGAYIETIPAFSASSFGKTVDGNYLFFNNYLPVLPSHESIRRADQILILANPKGKMIRELSDQIDHLGKFPGGGTPTSIGHYNGTLNIVVNRSSDVYELRDKTLTKKFHFVFIPNNLPNSLPKNHNDFDEEDYNSFRNKNFIEIKAYRESDTIATFWFINKVGLMYCIFDKRSNHANLFQRDKFTNDINQLPFGHILHIDSKSVTTYLQMADFMDNMEKILSDSNSEYRDQFINSHQTLVDIYQNSKRDDNPIIATYFLK